MRKWVARHGILSAAGFAIIILWASNFSMLCVPNIDYYQLGYSTMSATILILVISGILWLIKLVIMKLIKQGKLTKQR